MMTEFPSLSVEIIEPVNVKDPKFLMTSLQELILNEDMIPFKLENFFYVEFYLYGGSYRPRMFSLSDQNQLIEKLANFIVLDRKSENAGWTLGGVNVEIKKSVLKVPDEEFHSWVYWYDEQKRVYLDFEEEYKRAISVPWDPDEIFDEVVCLMAKRSAGTSIIRELESVVVNGKDDEGGDAWNKSCSICLEKFHSGEFGTRLPCHHVFHKGCIVRWLAGNHVCPLCRHQLPVTSE